MKGKIESVTLYECYAWRIDELDATALKGLELAQHGVTQFRQLEGNTPVQAFSEAVSSSATARLAALYLEHIAHYQAHPPGDDCDDVRAMTSK